MNERKITQYKEALQTLLTGERYEHSLNVAKTAQELAKKYGADVDKAYIAGLLHDCMKDASYEKQLQMIDESDTILTSAEKASDRLWHALAGAFYVKKVFGVTDDEIVEAIRYHTTGRENMTLLEKCVFVADYTSKDRTYSGVSEMRKFAFDDIDKAMLEGLRFTIESLSKSERSIHPDSILIYNQLVLEKQQTNS